MTFSTVMIVIAVVLAAVGAILGYKKREYRDDIPAAFPIKFSDVDILMVRTLHPSQRH